MNPAAGTPFARQSNLDIKTGEVIPPDDRRMVYQLANMLWHSDSSFKPVPSLCSLLSARIVPPAGGATEFASARAAYPSLPEALKRRVETAVVVHDFSWSRDQVRPGFFTAEERAVYPPVRHPLVRVNPVNGRPALFLGAHASHVEGLPIEEGRALLRSCSTTSPSPSSSTATSGRRATWWSGTTAACSTARRPTTPRTTSGSCSAPRSPAIPAEP